MINIPCNFLNSFDGIIADSLEAKEALELIDRMDSVIGLKLIETAGEEQKKAIELEAKQNAAFDHTGDPEAAEIDALVAERVAAKKAKDFARADQIRDELTALGIVVTDTPKGVVWTRQ